MHSAPIITIIVSGESCSLVAVARGSLVCVSACVVVVVVVGALVCVRARGKRKAEDEKGEIERSEKNKREKSPFGWKNRAQSGDPDLALRAARARSLSALGALAARRRELFLFRSAAAAVERGPRAMLVRWLQVESCRFRLCRLCRQPRCAALFFWAFTAFHTFRGVSLLCTAAQCSVASITQNLDRSRDFRTRRFVPTFFFFPPYKFKAESVMSVSECHSC